MPDGYFDPLPPAKVDFDALKKWLRTQNISVQQLIAGQLVGGTLSSSNWDGGDDLSGGQDTDATEGFLLDGPDGSAQFLGSVWAGGIGFLDSSNDNTHVGSINGFSDELLIVGVGTKDVRIAALSGGAVAVSVGGSEVGRFTDEGLRGVAAAGSWLDETASGFTNTSFADLDALTGAAFSAPVAVTRETGTSALVTISASSFNINTSGLVLMSYRVSGATTLASSDNIGPRNQATTQAPASFSHVRTGLTPGNNTFEVQARVTANSGRIITPSITVIPL